MTDTGVAAPPRLHFLDAQRRHRRASTVSAALVVVALALSGIPLSVIISPMLVAGAAVVVRLADLRRCSSPRCWRRVRWARPACCT